MDQDKRKQLHGRLEEASRAAVVRWLDDRETEPGSSPRAVVAQEIGAIRDEMEGIAEPIFKMGEYIGMPAQSLVTTAIACRVGAVGWNPDDTEWPDPYALTLEPLRSEAWHAARSLVDSLWALADRLENAGVPLHAQDISAMVVLAQLVLLDVPLTGDAAGIVDDLDILAVGHVDAAAATVGVTATAASRHASATDRRALDRLASDLVKRSAGGYIKGPYAGGRRRKPSAKTEKLRAALAEIRRKHPDVTASRLLNQHPDLLRAEMGLGKRRRLPDQRTIERNWPKDSERTSSGNE